MDISLADNNEQNSINYPQDDSPSNINVTFAISEEGLTLNPDDEVNTTFNNATLTIDEAVEVKLDNDLNVKAPGNKVSLLTNSRQIMQHKDTTGRFRCLIQFTKFSGGSC